MSEPGIWYYEWNGRQAGPVPHASLVDLVRSGQLGPEARVWRSGMRGWEAVRDVPEVAAAIPAAAEPPPEPPPAASGASAVAPAPAAAPPPAAAIEPVSWPTLVALTIVTFGVYGVVRYYQAGRAYEALAGRASRFPTWFWLYVGLGLGGFVLGVVGGPLGLAAGVASLVFGVLSLLEALALRGEGVRRRRVAPHFTSDSAHRALTIAAAATSWAGVGVILALVEGILFFQDHDALARALLAPAPPAAQPAAAARLCGSCGNALAAPARFCDRCGAPVPST
jgi:GYF domain 2